MEKSTKNLDEIKKKLKTAEEMLKDLKKDLKDLKKKLKKDFKEDCNFKTKIPSEFAKPTYIRKNNLRDKNTARVIYTDELNYTYFNLQKYMSKHL